MPAAQWAHVLSLDLGWMPPAAARGFVEAGVRAALLRPDGDDLRLAVDPATVAIPVGFRPQPITAAASAPPAQATPVADPFLDWVDRLASDQAVERAAVLARVAEVQASMGGSVSALAALLWLAARAGLDVRATAAAVTP